MHPAIEGVMSFALGAIIVGVPSMCAGYALIKSVDIYLSSRSSPYSVAQSKSNTGTRT